VKEPKGNNVVTFLSKGARSSFRSEIHPLHDSSDQEMFTPVLDFPSHFSESIHDSGFAWNREADLAKRSPPRLLTQCSAICLRIVGEDSVRLRRQDYESKFSW